jgi:hypothetical protein
MGESEKMEYGEESTSLTVACELEVCAASSRAAVRAGAT